MLKVPELPKVKLTKETYGSNIFLGISGDNGDIDKYFLFLHNYGATPYEGELIWIYKDNNNIDPGFAKIQLNEEKLFSAYQTYFYLFFTNNMSLSEDDSEKKANKVAEEIVEGISRDPFLIERNGEIVISGW